MKQELTITVDVPQGYKAYWNGYDLLFVDDEMTELPKSWEEFCENNNVHIGEAYIDSCSIISELLIEKDRSKFYKNTLPDEALAEQHLALMQLHQLRDCYRQGWKPDWIDDN